MADYLDIPITAQPDDLAQVAFDYIADRIPGWAPAPGGFDTILIEALAEIAAETAQVALLVPKSIFQFFGTDLLNLPPVTATHATAPVTFTVQDSAGYTIPEGFAVGIPVSGDELIGFETTEALVIPPGSTTGSTVLSSILTGSEGSGIPSTATPVPLDALTAVVSIDLTEDTQGGTDDEDEDAYLERLSTQLQLLSPRPIKPEDFATIALTVPGVGRAQAIDNYNPDDDTSDNALMVTVALTQEDGEPVAGGVGASVLSLLESLLISNYTVKRMDPNYTSVDVAFTLVAVSSPDFDLDFVHDQVVAAVTDFLSPAKWGWAPLATSGSSWVPKDKVRYLEVAEVINRVEGVDYISTLTICVAAGTPGTSDITLDPVAALTRPGTISGTVA